MPRLYPYATLSSIRLSSAAALDFASFTCARDGNGMDLDLETGEERALDAMVEEAIHICGVGVYRVSGRVRSPKESAVHCRC